MRGVPAPGMTWRRAGGEGAVFRSQEWYGTAPRCWWRQLFFVGTSLLKWRLHFTEGSPRRLHWSGEGAGEENCERWFDCRRDVDGDAGGGADDDDYGSDVGGRW